MSTSVATAERSRQAIRRTVKLVVLDARDRVALVARHTAHRVAVARGRLARAAQVRERLDASDGTPNWEDAEWQ